MEPVDVHVAQARRTTATALKHWSLPETPVEDAQLVVSELVSNAIIHGSGDVRLRLRHDGHELRIQVTDDSTAPARRRRASAADLGGRGLHLVACLSLRWGVEDGGRTTYAVIPTLTEAPPCRLTTQSSTEPTCWASAPLIGGERSTRAVGRGPLAVTTPAGLAPLPRFRPSEAQGADCHTTGCMGAHIRRSEPEIQPRPQAREQRPGSVRVHRRRR
ncbi:ATP-binding protein [Streptomyces albidoflavus]